MLSFYVPSQASHWSDSSRERAVGKDAASLRGTVSTRREMVTGPRLLRLSGDEEGVRRPRVENTQGSISGGDEEGGFRDQLHWHLNNFPELGSKQNLGCNLGMTEQLRPGAACRAPRAACEMLSGCCDAKSPRFSMGLMLRQMHMQPQGVLGVRQSLGATRVPVTRCGAHGRNAGVCCTFSLPLNAFEIFYNENLRKKTPLFKSDSVSLRHRAKKCPQAGGDPWLLFHKLRSS